MGAQPVQLHRALSLEGSMFGIMLCHCHLEMLIIFRQRAPHFHFALRLANYMVNLHDRNLCWSALLFIKEVKTNYNWNIPYWRRKIWIVQCCQELVSPAWSKTLFPASPLSQKGQPDKKSSHRICIHMKYHCFLPSWDCPFRRPDTPTPVYPMSVLKPTLGKFPKTHFKKKKKKILIQNQWTSFQVEIILMWQKSSEFSLPLLEYSQIKC